jgi:hypothetical protein
MLDLGDARKPTCESGLFPTCKPISIIGETGGAKGYMHRGRHRSSWVGIYVSYEATPKVLGTKGTKSTGAKEPRAQSLALLDGCGAWNNRRVSS